MPSPTKRSGPISRMTVRVALQQQREKLARIKLAQMRENFLKALWLFFPSILFLLLGYFFFWQLTQGKDLMVITLENPREKTSFAEFSSFMLGLIFWVYVTWFSTRLVAKAKAFMHPEQNGSNGWKAYLVHTPRLISFSCISIILLAFFQLDEAGAAQLSSLEAHLLFVVSIIFYFVLYEMWMMYLLSNKEERNAAQWKNFLKNTRSAFSFFLAWFCTLFIWKRNFFSLVLMLAALQIFLVLLMIVRQELDALAKDATKKTKDAVSPSDKLWKRIVHITWEGGNRRLFILFLIISGIALVIYLLAIESVSAAVYIGPFPFILLAFGVLLGFGNLLTFLSVLMRTNWHFLLFLLALIFGAYFDSHKLQLPKRDAAQPSFAERQDLREYLTNWLQDTTRRKISLDTTREKYPVYFVLANGGASRSGYWTAKILGELEDVSGGEFSKHLFCLSGASGGSVGNATFFSLLRAKKTLEEKKLSYSEAAGTYLRSDFLTYTLSHLLGPDIFRNIFPFINVFGIDRGRALAIALERAPGRECMLYDSMGVKFSSIIARKGDRSYPLPVLCINATSMRDGNPAVFSNISIRSGLVASNNYFNNRVDVLQTLGPDRDIKLSTAVVLGASFPYISPAGRIDSVTVGKNGKRKTGSSQYYVDGGYFDNSGAGFVNEMMIGINDLIATDDSLKKYAGRLEFFVLHIMNTDPKTANHKPINSMTNDLLAPFKTMLGSYGKQTTVNDERLKSYLRSINKEPVDNHYRRIDLYDPQFADSSKTRYSMNWVISGKQLRKMDAALQQNQVFLNEKKMMGDWKPKP